MSVPQHRQLRLYPQLLSKRALCIVSRFRKAGYEAIDCICDYYIQLQNSNLPVYPNIAPGSIIRSLPESPPQNEEPIDDIVEDLHSKILPGVTHWQHPEFFAYVRFRICSQILSALTL